MGDDEDDSGNDCCKGSTAVSIGVPADNVGSGAALALLASLEDTGEAVG